MPGQCRHTQNPNPFVSSPSDFPGAPNHSSHTVEPRFFFQKQSATSEKVQLDNNHNYVLALVAVERAKAEYKHSVFLIVNPFMVH